MASFVILDATSPEEIPATLGKQPGGSKSPPGPTRSTSMNTAKADLIVKQALLAHKRSARLVNRRWLVVVRGRGSPRCSTGLTCGFGRLFRPNCDVALAPVFDLCNPLKRLKTPENSLVRHCVYWAYLKCEPRKGLSYFALRRINGLATDIRKLFSALDLHDVYCKQKAYGRG